MNQIIENPLLVHWGGMTNTAHIFSRTLYLGNEAYAPSEWGFTARLVLLHFFADKHFWLFTKVNARSTSMNFAIGADSTELFGGFSLVPGNWEKEGREKVNPVAQHNT